jgi:glycosyltransferase involved in cell wall biosynthesis
MPEMFRVATFAPGGTTSQKLPFQQYPTPVHLNYILPELPGVWNDFAGNEKGVVLSIWNAGWLGWLANCESLPDSELKSFLRTNPFKRWAYVPVDGHCVGGGLPRSIGDILGGFDRVLAYTRYGEQVIEQAMFGKETFSIPFLPHGLDTSVFYPRDRAEARRTLVQRVVDLQQPSMSPSVFLVGICATNTRRKDWHLAFEVCAELMKRGVRVGLWAHTNAPKKDWDLMALAETFGLQGRVLLSTRNLSDEDMAWCYSACNVTLGIGSGEGWGFPLAESLACGVPVIHGKYAGGAEYVPKPLLVEPKGYRGDGLYGILRPVFKASDWAYRAMEADNQLVALPEYIDWNNAWPLWKQWLREGI